jgi:hypothetical protein
VTVEQRKLIERELAKLIPIAFKYRDESPSYIVKKWLQVVALDLVKQAICHDPTPLDTFSLLREFSFA